jgi:hypothetical protein
MMICDCEQPRRIGSSGGSRGHIRGWLVVRGKGTAGDGSPRVWVVRLIPQELGGVDVSVGQKVCRLERESCRWYPSQHLFLFEEMVTLAHSRKFLGSGAQNLLVRATESTSRGGMCCRRLAGSPSDIVGCSGNLNADQMDG